MNPKQNKRIVVVGASSVIAQQCARQWAREAIDLVLVGRNAARTETVAADLRVRSPSSVVTVVTADLSTPAGIAQVVQEVSSRPIDIALVAHGFLPDQHACQHDLGLAAEAIGINGLSPVLFAEAFASRMETQGRGSVVLVGSVAGDRGRKSNYVYGAAKGLVTRYAQGLQHRFASSGVHVMLVKPGPTDTPMTAHLRAQGARLASPDEVARCIVRGVSRRSLVVYAPGRWWLIMMIIRHLPHFIFKRMDI